MPEHIATIRRCTNGGPFMYTHEINGMASDSAKGLTFNDALDATQPLVVAASGICSTIQMDIKGAVAADFAVSGSIESTGRDAILTALYTATKGILQPLASGPEKVTVTLKTQI